MRKFLALLCAFITVVLMGCSQSPNKVPSDSTNDTSATEQNTPPTDFSVSQKPMVAVSVPAVTETTTAPDGTAIFHYIYQNISLVVPEQEIADKVIINFLNRVDKSVAPADDIRRQAENAYSGSGSWTPYLYSLVYYPTRVDQGVLSLYGVTASYSGSSHPNYTCTAANYDLITGQVLTLGSILTHADKKSTLKDLVLEELEALRDIKNLHDDYEVAVNARFSREESYDEDWIFTTTGLSFYFAPYEVAPYSSGIVVATVPYEKLTGIIADAFFPAESDTSKGNVEIELLENADLTAFTQIGELILNKGGSQYLIHTDGILQNPRVAVRNPVTEDSYIAFCTQHLTPGDAVMVEVNTDNITNVRFLYEENGNTISIPLQ